MSTRELERRLEGLAWHSLYKENEHDRLTRELEAMDTAEEYLQDVPCEVTDDGCPIEGRWARYNDDLTVDYCLTQEEYDNQPCVVDPQVWVQMRDNHIQSEHTNHITDRDWVGHEVDVILRELESRG